jgi:hypothetical protein
MEAIMCFRMILLLAWLAFPPGILHGQLMRGRVSDYMTRDPVRGATASLIDAQGNPVVEATSDASGAFELRSPRSGSYRLRVAMIGYLPFNSDPLALTTRDVTQVLIQISAQPIPITPVVVNALSSGRMAEFERRRARQGAGYFITQADIAKRPLASATSLVLGVPGATIVAAGPPGSGAAAFGRSIIRLRATSMAGAYNQPNECTPAVFLDGRPIQGYIDDHIVPDWIGGVEVYVNELTAPSEYQRGNGCGVVLYWTRDPENGRRRWNFSRVAAVVGISVFVVVVAVN